MSNVKDSKTFDDQNELDYEEELVEAKETANPNIKPDIVTEKATEDVAKENTDGEIDDDSDGEVKTDDEDGKMVNLPFV